MNCGWQAARTTECRASGHVKFLKLRLLSIIAPVPAEFTALKIRHRKFYCTRYTITSVMLSQDENIKRVSDYTGTSVIEKHYGRFVRKDSNFGMRASAQWENASEKFLEAVDEDEKIQQVGWSPRRDLNPFPNLPTTFINF
jgi:hypothetical protein